MINAAMLFAVDDQISLLHNELHKLRAELRRVLDKNNDSAYRETIGSLIAKRDYMHSRISNLEKRRERCF